MTATGELTVNAVSKWYGQNQALNDVNLRIASGQTVALIGHNGAGKSTLLRALSGVEIPDQGTISIDGSPVQFHSPGDATAARITCVHQELSLINELTVSENLFLGTEELVGPLLNRRAMNRRAQALCEEYGIHVAPTDLVRDLPVAQRQLLEVARAINRNARFLLLDEPTTSLEQDQVNRLLDVIRRLTGEQGLGILFVNHKLDEVFAVSDHVVGLSNGSIVLNEPASSVSLKDVIEAIVGEGEDAKHILAETGPDLSLPSIHASAELPPEPVFGDDVLKVEGLAGAGLTGIDLRVRAGEILGIYGLVGSGRSRFLRRVFGVEPSPEGRMLLAGKPYAPSAPSSAIAAGVAYLSEERKFDGFVPAMSAVENVGLPVLDRFERMGILDLSGLRRAALANLDRTPIRGDIHQPITTLSGGNQQKALFARAIMQQPRLLLLDEPTKGVDISAKQDLHDIIRNLAHEHGIAIIVVSSEEEELIGVADTITVFRNGGCGGRCYRRDQVLSSQLKNLAWAATEGEKTETAN